MSNSYRLVQWNHHKRVYDVIMLGGIALYLMTFVGIGSALYAGDEAVSAPVLIMRALGTCALVMLHVTLAIGPLARLDRRFAPLLYNRRHLGVATFVVSLFHALASIGFYGGFGVDDPFTALLARYDSSSLLSVSGFPFELLGMLALVILFVMAATSHDFWLKNLGPRLWKWIHMLVYGAYGLLVLHVALGSMQSERSLVYPILLGAGIVTLGTLHMLAARKELRREAASITPPDASPAGEHEWVDVGSVDEIRPDRAMIVCLKDRERVAIFRHGDAVSAISNVCAHQGGPLGEGKIVDGCVTCPWHGYQYRPESGQSPPPYTEKIPTYQVRVAGRRILLHPEPLAPGTRVEPARVEPKIEERSDG